MEDHIKDRDDAARGKKTGGTPENAEDIDTEEPRDPVELGQGFRKIGLLEGPLEEVTIHNQLHDDV